MNISSREKFLSAVFIIVAIYVIYSFMSGDINGSALSESSGTRSFSSMSINRYKHIKPLQKLTEKKKTYQFSSLKRNIFQFGRSLPSEKTQEEILRTHCIELSKMLAGLIKSLNN